MTSWKQLAWVPLTSHRPRYPGFFSIFGCTAASLSTHRVLGNPSGPWLPGWIPGHCAALLLGYIFYPSKTPTALCLTSEGLGPLFLASFSYLRDTIPLASHSGENSPLSGGILARCLSISRLDPALYHIPQGAQATLRYQGLSLPPWI